MSKKIKLLYVDLFCGAGGTSSGIHLAKNEEEGIAEVVVCVNHDANAIKSHMQNFPNSLHLTEDIRTVAMEPIVKAINERKSYWVKKGYKVYVCLWASLECTNFSKAKGGMPRNADSRTLAEHLFRYLKAYMYDFIDIENVEEFMSWGPLNIAGKPISRNAGTDYMKWINEVQSLGYDYAYKILNAADYGAYTTRKRYFGCFARTGLPIRFPEATHSKNPDNGLFTSFKKWKAVKECLDFNDKGQSILSRTKHLSPKTLERVYAGLIKYIAGGKEVFIAKYNSFSASQGYKHTAANVDEPSPVISTQNRLGVVHTSFIKKYYSGRPEGKVISVEQPAGSITCIDGHALVQPTFLKKYYGNGNNISSPEEPAGTITTKDRIAIVQPKFFIDKQFSGSHNHQSIEVPAGAILCNDKHTLVETNQLVLNTNYIVNPAWGGNNGSIDNPCCTIVARQDKAPLYIVNIELGTEWELDVHQFFTDEDFQFLMDNTGEKSVRVRIVEFMALYGIIDIQMRMLKILELLRIQGFINPDGDENDYKLVGTQTEKKKYIGNSVVPLQVKHLLESRFEVLSELSNYKAA